MTEKSGVGQCVITYDHKGRSLHCGMTFFQCDVTPVVILTDIDCGVSVTNSIESAASFVRSMHFLHIKPEKIIFFEHYSRESGEDEFYQVKMSWSAMSERYCSPQFIETSARSLKHFLSCYGFRKDDLPDMRFAPAKIISFNR